MRILLLRAGEDAARSAPPLQKMGHQVVHSPVIEFADTGARVPNDAYHAVLATSPQAFGSLDDEEIGALRTLPLYCVGSRASLAAIKIGLRSPHIIGRDAAGLAEQLIKKYPAPVHFLYLAGSDRKPDLEDSLNAAGHRVTAHETYRADPVKRLSRAAGSALEYGDIDIVLHYSRRSVEIFMGLAKAAKLDLATPAHFCLSADVAVPLQQAGYEKIVIADEPNENSMFSKLKVPLASIPRPGTLI